MIKKLNDNEVKVKQHREYGGLSVLLLDTYCVVTVEQ
jgi:hypothetical protein